MCRYAWHHYRDHFACFACRKAFKHWQWQERDEPNFRTKQRLVHVRRTVVCPDCARPMTEMGLDFKAPRQADTEPWEILRRLAECGVTFQGCGCYVGYRPPRQLREVPRWLEAQRRKSEGEKLLTRYAQRR